ncbi:MAG: hypothetical protein BWY15_00037 [Firmicutes bacterium ADurb.Bin193]|nr:MAG: hypothetical protein BWY15_00037 [Firmicutes bacterium ADurb.Bin193]
MIEIKDISKAENVVFMRMTEGERILCEAWAEIDRENDTAKIIDIKEHENGFSYDMGKALLNALDLKKIKKVVCENEALESTLLRLRFKKEFCAYLLSLDGYFMSNC